MSDSEKDDKGAVDLKFVESLLDVLVGMLPLSDEGKGHFKRMVLEVVRLLDAEIEAVDTAVDTDG